MKNSMSQNLFLASNSDGTKKSYNNFLTIYLVVSKNVINTHEKQQLGRCFIRPNFE